MFRKIQAKETSSRSEKQKKKLGIVEEGGGTDCGKKVYRVIEQNQSGKRLKEGETIENEMNQKGRASRWV